MFSSDTIISMAVGLGGLAATIIGTWIGYQSLKAMRANRSSSMSAKVPFSIGTFTNKFPSPLSYNDPYECRL